MADVAGWMNADGIHEMGRILGAQGVQAAADAYHDAGATDLHALFADYAARMRSGGDLDAVDTSGFPYGEDAERVPAAWLEAHPEEMVLDWDARMPRAIRAASLENRRLLRQVELAAEALVAEAEPCAGPTPLPFEHAIELPKRTIGGTTVTMAPGPGWFPNTLQGEVYDRPSVSRVRAVLRRDQELVAVPVGCFGAQLATRIRQTSARAEVMAAVHRLVLAWCGSAAAGSHFHLREHGGDDAIPTAFWASKETPYGGWRDPNGAWNYRDHCLDTLDWFSPILLWVGR